MNPVPVATISAGDVGSTITVNVATAGYAIPSTATCALFLAPGPAVDENPQVVVGPVTIVNSSEASYQTTGSVLTSGGTWNGALRVYASSGAIIFTTARTDFEVNDVGPLVIMGIAAGAQAPQTGSATGTVTPP